MGSEMCIRDSHNMPQSLDDLSVLPAIIYSNNPAGLTLNYNDAAGIIGSASLRTQFCANSAGMMLEACLRGVGIALLPSFCCEDQLASGDLIRLLPDVETSPDRGIYAIYPDRRFLPLKVQAFIDILEDSLRMTRRQ